MSRREFLEKTYRVGLGLASVGLLGTLQACNSRSPETSPARVSPEIVSLPAVLEMPFGSEFTVEKVPLYYNPPRLNLNKTVTEQLLREIVIKPTASIKVSLFPDDWLTIQPDGMLLGINDQRYQSLSQEEKNKFKDGLTTTVYDPQSGIPQGVAVHIATGRYLEAAREGKKMIVQNEFLPEGITVNPIIALNATFYHEVRYHALLRDIDYRKQNQQGQAEEEASARKGETEWIKNLTNKGATVRNDELFLIPY